MLSIGALESHNLTITWVRKSYNVFFFSVWFFPTCLDVNQHGALRSVSTDGVLPRTAVSVKGAGEEMTVPVVS